MEQRFDADFSDVRVHTDTAAKASASRIGARAYTSGHHIVIGEGGGDRRTLAHELTHVIQQHQGPVAGTDNGSGLRVSDPADRFEQEAEANATRVMRAPVHETVPPARTAPRTPVPDALEPFVQRLTIPTAAPTGTLRNTSMNAGRAGESEILTDGHLQGDPPGVDPLGYDYIRSLFLTRSWIRFHLVSEEAGGLGTAGNLVPASQSDNQRYERSIENQLKNDVRYAAGNPGSYVYFGVQVTYHGQAPATVTSQAQRNSAENFPSSLAITHKLYTPTNGWQDRNQTPRTFDFLTPQPTDPQVPMPLASITLGDLKAYTGLPPGSNIWQPNDVQLLKEIGTPGTAVRIEFQRLTNGNTNEFEWVARALATPFSVPVTTHRGRQTTSVVKLGGNVPEDARDTLADVIAAGRLTL